MALPGRAPMTTRGLAHSVSSLCTVAADRAFAYVSSPDRLGEWALGCWGAVPSGAGIVRGTSLFDGTESFARPLADGERLVVDFQVGDRPDRLARRISVRVVPGEEIGEAATTSLVVLTAWRIRSMDDERWRRLVVAHEAEILLLRHRIESAAS